MLRHDFVSSSFCITEDSDFHNFDELWKMSDVDGHHHLHYLFCQSNSDILLLGTCRHISNASVDIYAAVIESTIVEILDDFAPVTTKIRRRGGPGHIRISRVIHFRKGISYTNGEDNDLIGW